jgi:hypothetical protein
MLASAACRPRDNIKVESPEPEVLSSVVNTSDPAVAPQLIVGFHEIEQGSWRWTAGKFAVAFKSPARSGGQAARLVMHCSVPEALTSRVGAVTLTAKLNGATLGVQKWETPGEYTFTAAVPASQLSADAVTVDFSLDKFLPAGQADARELGLIVTSVAIEAVE